MKEVLWCFMCIKEKTLGENYKEAYELWRDRNLMTRINIGAKLLLNQKNYILKAKRKTVVEIDEIKENKIWNDREDHTKGLNGYKMDTNDKERQKRDQESNNTGLGKTEHNKNPGAQREQHTVKKKLKEDLQRMLHKVWRLLMTERERLPKLKENSKLIKLKEDINSVADELLEEDESDITDINNLIYAAAIVMTQKMNQPSKTSKNRRYENFGK